MNKTPDPAAPAEIDPRDLRNALGMFATGVTIVTAINGEGRPVGITCNSFSSVSLKPPLILWSLSLYSPNLQTFLQAPCFAINVLASDQQALSRRFSTPSIDRFAGIKWAAGENGIPLIPGVAAQIQCRNETRHYSGDHVILIGQVLRYVYRNVEPLIFARGRYLTLLGSESGPTGK